jgi:hypothetical protein
MVTVCAWCQKYMGSREPFGEARVSHGICDACLARESLTGAPAPRAGRDHAPEPPALEARRRPPTLRA